MSKDEKSLYVGITAGVIAFVAFALVCYLKNTHTPLGAICLIAFAMGCLATYLEYDRLSNPMANEGGEHDSVLPPSP